MRLANLLVSGVAVAIALTFAVPAAASGTWTVSGGTSWSGSSSNLKLMDINTGATFSCPSASFSGTIRNGTGLSGTGIGTVTSSSGVTCSGPSGGSASIAQLSGVTENLDALSYNSGTGVTTGDLSNIDLMVSFSDLFGSCAFIVAGTADATYTNSTHILHFTGAGSLTARSATGTGCAGVVKAGDSFSLTGDVTITPGIIITSP